VRSRRRKTHKKQFLLSRAAADKVDRLYGRSAAEARLTRLVRALLLGSESRFREYVADMVAELIRIEGCRSDGIGEPTHERSAGDIPWLAQVMELLRSYGVGIKSLRLLPKHSGFVSGYLQLKPTRLVRALLLGSESRFREYVADMVTELIRIEGCRSTLPPAITPAAVPSRP